MNQVSKAQPFEYDQMGSFGNASGMILRQYRFPDTYTNKEKIETADHDRIVSYFGHEHWGECIQKAKWHMKNSGFERWLQEGAPDGILSFLVDVLKLDSNIKWTGFRILGTVNRSTGYPVYSLQVFAKDPKSKTKVYSNLNAPNVIQRHWELRDEEFALRNFLTKTL